MCPVVNSEIKSKNNPMIFLFSSESLFGDPQAVIHVHHCPNPDTTAFIGFGVVFISPLFRTKDHSPSIWACIGSAAPAGRFAKLLLFG